MSVIWQQSPVLKRGEGWTLLRADGKAIFGQLFESTMLEPRLVKTSLRDQRPTRWPSGTLLLSRLRKLTAPKSTEKSVSTAAMAGKRTPPRSPALAGKRTPSLSPVLAGKRSASLSPRRASPSRKLFFSHVPMKAPSNRSPKTEPGATKRLGEILGLQSSTTPRSKRRISRLSDAAQTDAGAKQFLRSRRRACRPKELKLRDGAWPPEVFELVKSVFGISTFFLEKEILFHTVTKIAAVLRRSLRRKARRKGEAILKCLVQEYRARSVGSWRPWLLLLLHAGTLPASFINQSGPFFARGTILG
ncbi:hypothetical protein AK812_SmicGene40019 [Symbiodinium microadriaticum]|uniref:Uncharacterized protein n=1 Tax=Symbiodinium microadriaticum TaxID=2951 RepID=A0A1Q9C9S8_SYMMI|nr:hypothetical protein AK812_SmicGene40019 [Symbiodinium microadriaticum]